ncbi:unnamed protein product [Rangifer tarandus platyrhynchus]|uniref:Uncharacterized protein n=2 Tax=Rangifer tarandus platyrhynchus TaxID=3082113 RepID=A0ACB0F572_RANTA|nr:unnamed protein product [Rangifer tarandus platyrhynchus]CAI9707998.1 unnamed protein product [Rangifer tarandus platyrhynchus]
MAAREPGPRGAEHRPRHSSGAGSDRPRWPQTWPLGRDRLPKERPAWGAGRGPGSSPPAPAAPPPSWLCLGCARRSANGGGNDGDHGTPGAVSSEAISVGTAQGLVAPRFRQQRPGSPRAAPSTRHPGARAGRDPTPPRQAGPPGGLPALPTAPARAATPVPGSAHSRTPGPLTLRLLGYIAAACPWGPTPTSQVRAAPSTRRPPAPGMRSPRLGPRRARAGLSRAPVRTPGAGGLPPAHLRERPRGPARLSGARRRQSAQRVLPAPPARAARARPPRRRGPALTASWRPRRALADLRNAPRRGRGREGGCSPGPGARARERAGAPRPPAASPEPSPLA